MPKLLLNFLDGNLVLLCLRKNLCTSWFGLERIDDKQHENVQEMLLE